MSEQVMAAKSRGSRDEPRRAGDLRSAVVAALLQSGYAALTNVACDVSGGRIILRGSVPSYHLKQLAQVFSQRVTGVGKVENRLAVSG